MTTRKIVERMLMQGKHITKFDLLTVANSVCLAQRIQEIRNSGWDVQSKTVKGKGTLVEYWLEQAEIDRILGRNSVDEQLVKESENIAETPHITPKNAQEQQPLGLFGEL